MKQDPTGPPPHPRPEKPKLEKASAPLYSASTAQALPDQAAKTEPPLKRISGASEPQPQPARPPAQAEAEKLSFAPSAFATQFPFGRPTPLAPHRSTFFRVLFDPEQPTRSSPAPRTLAKISGIAARAPGSLSRSRPHRTAWASTDFNQRSPKPRGFRRDFLPTRRPIVSSITAVTSPLSALPDLILGLPMHKRSPRRQRHPEGARAALHPRQLVPQRRRHRNPRTSSPPPRPCDEPLRRKARIARALHARCRTLRGPIQSYSISSLA